MPKLSTTKTPKSKPSHPQPEPDYLLLEKEWLEQQMYRHDDRGYYDV
jgi:hypothetical protein